jgi:thymidylate synthase ThyX
MLLVESFSEQESKVLSNYVSNLDSDVFVLRNLPEAVKGALFSRYSRSPKGLRRLLLDEFIQNREFDFPSVAGSASPADGPSLVNKQKADDFYVRVLDGYGDDSVGELGGCHIALENISNVATKVIEDARIGGSPLEKSTRYVFFDQKVNGKYAFFEEPNIMASPFREEYVSLMNDLFDTYAALVQPLSDFMKKKHPIDEFAFMVDISTREEKKFPDIADDAVRKRAQAAYNASIRAKTCDVLRGLLPASTLTNVGLYGNGRFFEYLLRKLYSHPLSEMRLLGKSMHQELDSQVSSFVRRARKDEYLASTRARVRSAVETLTEKTVPVSAKPVTLVESDPSAEKKLLAYILYADSGLPLAQLHAVVANLDDTERASLLSAYAGNRKTRRDRPGRAFENTYYTFDVLADYGIYRDLQRHRVLTQERQLLSTLHGFDVPPEIVDAGLEKQFEKPLLAADALYRKIADTMPFEAQYCVPMAYRIRWYMTMNLREAMHFIELRATKQGHENYRRIAQLMYYEIQKVHPQFAALFTHVDLNQYALSRLDAEMKQEHKRAEWKS